MSAIGVAAVPSAAATLAYYIAGLVKGDGNIKVPCVVRSAVSLACNDIIIK